MLRYLLVIMTFSFFSFANTPTLFNKQANILGNFSFTIEHTYDDSSNLLTTTKTLADGTVTTTSNTYDAFNRLVTSTDERGNTEQYVYDARGNKIKRTDIYGLETTYTYTNHKRKGSRKGSGVENTPLHKRHLHMSKSELIRKSVVEYENHMKKQALKKQIREASMRVCVSNSKIAKDFENTNFDGLRTHDSYRSTTYYTMHR